MLDAKFGGSTKVDKVHIMAIKNIWCQSSKCSRVLWEADYTHQHYKYSRKTQRLGVCEIYFE